MERNILREEFHPMMKVTLALAGAVVLFLGLAGGFIDWSGKNRSVSDDASAGRRPALTRHLLEGVRVRSGDVNSPVFLCQSVRVVKKKIGPFTFGAFNMLELNEFQLVFPSVPTERDGQKPVEEEEGLFMKTLGSSEGRPNIRSLLGMGEKISGLIIHRFNVGMQDGEQIGSILQAERAEAKPNGTLHLTGCRFVDEQGRAFISADGILSLERPVTLIAGRQRVVIRDVIKAFRIRELHATQNQSGGD